MTKPSIVFMGTPEFAAFCLTRLIERDFNVIGVVTVADKPAGRGQQIQESAVKKVARDNNIKILQPLSLKDEIFLHELSSWKADLFVVIAFRMLPELVWNMPPLRCINLHASILPQFRGAAPINHAIIAGEKETGVTTFFIEHEIDKGKILLQDRTEIGENETAGELHDRLMLLGAELVCKTLDGIFQGALKSKAQEDFVTVNLKHAPKIFKEACKINWNQHAQTVHDFVRGLSPYPAAWTVLLLPQMKTVKIFKTQKTEQRISDNYGEIVLDKNKMYVQCLDFALEIIELQVEGKSRVSALDFVHGQRGELKMA
jgi:methionyl-tRNA formyltransferase